MATNVNRKPPVMFGTFADRPVLPKKGLPQGLIYICTDPGTNRVFFLIGTFASQRWVSASGVIYDDFDLYVDNVNGKDSAAGTAADPIQTLDEAQRRWPQFFAARAPHLHFAASPVTYALSDPAGVWTTAQALSSAKANEREAWIGEFVPVAGATGLVNTVDDPGGQTITVAGPLPVGLRGSFVKFTSGGNDGQWPSAKINDGTTITLQNTVGDIAIGDTCDVMRPGVHVNIGVIGTSGGFLSTSAIGFQGIEFVDGGQWSGTNPTFDRCWMRTNGNLIFLAWFSRMDQGPLFNDDLFDPGAFASSLYVYGTDGGGKGGSFTQHQYAIVQFASIISDDTYWLCDDDSTRNLFSCDFKNSPLVEDGGATLAIFTSVHDVAAGFQWNTESGPLSVTRAIDTVGDNHAEASPSLVLVMSDISSNTCGDAIYATAGTVVDLVGVTGSTNAGYGVHAEGIGRVRYDNTTTVAGDKGTHTRELSLGPLGYTYAAVAAFGAAPYTLDANGVYTGNKSISDPMGNTISQAL